MKLGNILGFQNNTELADQHILVGQEVMINIRLCEFRQSTNIGRYQNQPLTMDVKPKKN